MEMEYALTLAAYISLLAPCSSFLHKIDEKATVVHGVVSIWVYKEMMFCLFLLYHFTQNYVTIWKEFILSNQANLTGKIEIKVLSCCPALGQVLNEDLQMQLA